MLKAIFLCAICVAPHLRGQDTESPSIRLRVKSFARENAQITNPVAWVQLDDRTPDGTRVTEQDVVFTLDLDGVSTQVEHLENRLELADNQSEKEVLSMESTLQQLQDEKEILLDNRSIQQARLTYLLSLPRKQDIEIAQGRLTVAKERLDAEEKNLATMKERLERKLIAPLQVQQATWSTALQRARTEYAQQVLDIEMRPARPEEIQMVKLRIDNLNLEIEKLNTEIPTQEIILGINQDTRSRRVENIRKELTEKQEEMSFRAITSPADGVLLYSTQLKGTLVTGGRLSKHMVLAEIPKPDSIAFRGVIPEQTRHLFSVGDPVFLELNLYPGREYKGRLLSISPFSRDILEDAENPSGVKLVDVEMVLEDPPEHLPIGVYAWARLISQHPMGNNRVPISWVRYQGGKPHLSIRGNYTPVDGVVQKGSFILTPPHPALSEIQPDGEWPEEATELDVDTGNRFTSSGELLPLESVAVTTPNVRAWDMKVSWLAPENEQVEAGEPIATIDSDMIADDVQERLERAEEVRGEREATEQEIEIKTSQRDFQIASARNNLQIARLNRDLVLTKDTDLDVAKATLDLKTASIQLEAALAEKARGDRTPELTAPAERERQARDVVRNRLALERATFQLKQAKEGSTPRERSRAEIQAFREEARLAETESRFQRDMSRLHSRLKWRIRREQRNEERLRRVQEQQESMNITAPVSGFVQYDKVWDGVRLSKIRPGMRVWPNNRLVSLSNTSEVFVEVPLPERYVHKLEMGMPVQVIIPSEGNLEWRGRVTDFAEILEPARPDLRTGNLYGNQEVTREQVLPVRVVVESTSGRALKPGSIAQLIFPFEK